MHKAVTRVLGKHKLASTDLVIDVNASYDGKGGIYQDNKDNNARSKSVKLFDVKILTFIHHLTELRQIDERAKGDYRCDR